MKKFGVLLIAILVFSLAGCQSVTRNMGGTTKIELEAGEEFINITWKDDNIWVLVKSDRENAYVFKEYSNFGIMQGRVIVREKE
jgi:uncharacterized lipoprotein YehR (DUF1307 family)